nr:transmembrane protein 209 [Ipomoea batatas]
MEGGGGGGGREQSSAPPKPSKFTVYQNPALSAALTSNSLRPSKSTFLFLLSLSSASAFALLSVISRENGIVESLKIGYTSQETARLFTKVIQSIAGFFLIGTFLALVKAILLWRKRNTTELMITSPAKGSKEQMRLTSRQLGLLGIKPKVEQGTVESSKKPPKSKMTSPLDALVPVHQPISSASRSARLSSEKSSASSGSKIHTFSTPSKSPASQSLILVPTSSQSPSLQTSPWSNKRAPFHKEIMTEEDLEKFLADVDEKISESASKLSTPPPTISGFGVVSPSNMPSSANTSGTPRSTPLRPVRMSPGSQKFTTPPKKGEGDLPPPMSMIESIEAFEHLGIYPQIERWRDHLRQWFSTMLLNPLLNKIDTSHVKVMQSAAKLGITITVSQVGSEISSAGTTTVCTPGMTNEWQSSFSLDEDGLLHQLRANLVQTLDSCMSKLTPSIFQQSPQQSTLIPVVQECIDAITEHQRLLTLMKGEWGKGLLTQGSVRADYTVRRIRELAEGTCVKKYEYLGEVYDSSNKKWSSDLPTDSHLLLYLFCAFLEHPKWMLHVDPTAYAGSQSSKNPLFLGVLPPKERFPEKYVAVVSGVPSVLHPGACVLAVGKQSPPVFALFWDKKPQFSLQGRTAVWDSVLLLCYKIKVGYGGIVRGLHLGSSALDILSVLDPEPED